MNLRATIMIALGALRLNALRSGLAMLGIIIGVASVITMASISSGASKQVETYISNLGSNLLIARPGSSHMGGRRGGAGSGDPFTEKDVIAIRDQIEGLSAVSGSVRTSGVIIYGNKNWQTSIEGVHPAYHIARSWPVSEGEELSDEQVRRKAKVAVIGKTIAKQLFDGLPPVGQHIRIKNIPFEVIGVLAEKGQSGMGSDQDDTILVPISTARARLERQEGPVPDPVETIFISVTNAEKMAAIQVEIEALLSERRGIRPGDQANFNVRNMAEFITTRTATQSTLGVLLAASAAISLVVGGIGIMNIMLVSVTERTREIGLRMAVGARERDILVQFLVEAITLCTIGGMAGLLIGAGGASIFAQYADWPVLFEPHYIVLALIGSSSVGLFFGFYPARRASKLNPIDALRYE